MQVKKRLTPFAVVANYTYNALGQRISEQYDCNDSGNTGATDGVTDSYDPVFFIALDRAGRRVATFRGSDTNPKETFIYHASGSSSGYGPNFAGGGGVLLRDRDAACATPSNWATTAASATRAERYFYFADSRGSIMALVGADGVLAEQYRYSQTGVPFGIPGGDMDADGTVQGGSGQTDENIVKTAGYEVRKDLDLDGDVDGTDQAIVNAANGSELGRNPNVLEHRDDTVGCAMQFETAGQYASDPPQTVLAAGECLEYRPRALHLGMMFQVDDLLIPLHPESSRLGDAGRLYLGRINQRFGWLNVWEQGRSYQSDLHATWGYFRTDRTWKADVSLFATNTKSWGMYEDGPTTWTSPRLGSVTCTARASVGCGSANNPHQFGDTPFIWGISDTGPQAVTISDRNRSLTNGTIRIAHTRTTHDGHPFGGISITSQFDVGFSPSSWLPVQPLGVGFDVFSGGNTIATSIFVSGWRWVCECAQYKQTRRLIPTIGASSQQSSSEY